MLNKIFTIIGIITTILLLGAGVGFAYNYNFVGENIVKEYDGELSVEFLNLIRLENAVQNIYYFEDEDFTRITFKDRIPRPEIKRIDRLIKGQIAQENIVELQNTCTRPTYQNLPTCISIAQPIPVGDSPSQPQPDTQTQPEVQEQTLWERWFG